MWTLERALIDEHRRWLGGFHRQHGRNWEKVFAADPEAGTCEAAVRRALQNLGMNVEPNASIVGAMKSPDFLCRVNDDIFLVETTCLSIEKTSELTGLTHHVQPGATWYRPLNDAIFNACRQKTPQCSGQKYPTLVAVGTFHFQASGICLHRRHLEMLLTGQQMISCDISTETGEPASNIYQSTQLRSAAFLRPDDSTGLEHARNPVSGVVVLGFGGEPWIVRGVLHPDSNHPFDRRLLPTVEFCQLRPGYKSGNLSVEWV